MHQKRKGLNLPGRAMGLSPNSSAMAPTLGFGVMSQRTEMPEGFLVSWRAAAGLRGPRLWGGRTRMRAGDGERLGERRP